MNSLHAPLLTWYQQNCRHLPWRSNPTPYAVWVSEMMLQQTQVKTVLDYYARWMERFPTVERLATASEDEVLGMWQGLGYYQRARSLHAAAKLVSTHGFPRSVTDWEALPGVGPYTAGAISSIAQSLPAALVDGNVERVYARLTGDAAAGTSLNRNAWQWARENLARESPGDWNQALMELGATVCTPERPRCEECPLKIQCVARREGRQSELPSKLVRRTPTLLTHYMWIPHRGGNYAMEKIASGGWWEGMWSFPREDSETALWQRFPDATITASGQLRHVVTHHRITLNFSMVETQSPNLTYYSAAELSEMAIPAPHRKAWERVRLQPGLIC